MKNITLYILSLVLMLNLSFAQKVEEGNFPFVQKIKPMAYGMRLEVDAPPKTVATVLAQRFEDATKKKCNRLKKEIMEVKAATFPRLSTAILDYYYKVEPQGKTGAVVTLFLSAGNYNFLDKEHYVNEIAAAKSWLSELPEEVEIFERAKALKTQMAIIKKLEKEEKKAKKKEEKLAKLKTNTIDALENMKIAVEEMARKKEANSKRIVQLDAEVSANTEKQVARTALSISDTRGQIDTLNQDTLITDSTYTKVASPDVDNSLTLQRIEEKKRLKNQQLKLEKALQKNEKTRKKLNKAYTKSTKNLTEKREALDEIQKQLRQASRELERLKRNN